MGLNITQDPFWRHHRLAGQAQVFGERVRWFVHANDKQLQCAACIIGRQKLSTVAQIELPPGAMHEQSPPIRAKKKWDWNRSAMGRKKWRPLTVEHRIECSAPVKLICPLTEAKNRSVRAELQGIAVFRKNEFLDTL